MRPCGQQALIDPAMMDARSVCAPSRSRGGFAAVIFCRVLPIQKTIFFYVDARQNERMFQTTSLGTSGLARNLMACQSWPRGLHFLSAARPRQTSDRRRSTLRCGRRMNLFNEPSSCMPTMSSLALMKCSSYPNSGRSANLWSRHHDAEYVSP